MNGLAVTANNAADVALTELHFEDRHFAARNFRQHHVVRKFHELSNDKFEKLFHGKANLITNGHESTRISRCVILIPQSREKDLSYFVDHTISTACRGL